MLAACGGPRDASLCGGGAPVSTETEAAAAIANGGVGHCLGGGSGGGGGGGGGGAALDEEGEGGQASGWRARELTRYGRFKGARIRYMGPRSIWVGNSLTPDSRSH